eukprot:10147271-Ditylum_brightwellii.AAC.1
MCKQYLEQHICKKRHSKTVITDEGYGVQSIVSGRAYSTAWLAYFTPKLPQSSHHCQCTGTSA